MTLEDLQRRAKIKPKSIVFPDAEDPRTIRAAGHLINNKICTPILIGDSSRIRQVVDEESVEGVTIIDVEENLSDATSHIEARRAHKNISRSEAENLARDPLYAAGHLVASGKADGAVAGSMSTTSDVLRAGIISVGTPPTSSTVSSYFLMVWPETGKTLTYSDCGVIPRPTVQQLIELAYDASMNHQLLTQESARVAFVSFSTKGSADDESLVNIREAAAQFKTDHPDIISDGELQVDAALVPEVAEKKAPDSEVAGQANVLIFPDLNAGNIAYKVTQRLGGATALGPIIQGLSKPYCDLSRGCSVDDIVNVACITAIMAADS